MTIHNNYIFLPKQKKKAQEQHYGDNVIRIEMPKNVLSNIIEIFGKPTETNTHIKLFKETYVYEMKDDDATYYVSFTIINVSKYTYLDISLSRETMEKAIQSLEDIHNKIATSNIEDNCIMVVSYDSVSEYYCNEAYPKLNELERNLRRLLLNTYTINFGTKYFETTINEELQEKIKQTIQSRTKNREKRKIEQLKKFFYSMEFGDIQTLLFTERWTTLDEKDKEKFLSENQKLTELSEEELRAAFEKFSPKSDWERLFSNKATDVDIQQLIETVRSHRNDIAHCKFFYKEQYDSFCEAADELNNSIIEAINITEEKDFLKKKAEIYRTAMAGMSERFSQFNTMIYESLKPLYENMDYISSTLKNSFKALSESMYANSILALSNIESDDEIIEHNDNDNYSENEENTS
ncbi:MAG: hypothetical protein K2K70_03885 [Lachnospiraceae bacterium]|nr:hypothetical protein [Lachnospiraceae bacterium]